MKKSEKIARKKVKKNVQMPELNNVFEKGKFKLCNQSEADETERELNWFFFKLEYAQFKSHSYTYSVDETRISALVL